MPLPSLEMALCQVWTECHIWMPQNISICFLPDKASVLFEKTYQEMKPLASTSIFCMLHMPMTTVIVIIFIRHTLLVKTQFFWKRVDKTEKDCLIFSINYLISIHSSTQWVRHFSVLSDRDLLSHCEMYNIVDIDLE